ncbi:hypothetical protein BJI67_16365 (plasmid) [Acidihalobacter aeolianus]|uniref:Uncharacterized protein n=1 Tax=Acidihalobacter aeolianus TaxID=2792603 RepID=A0A1D8KCZ8_9GAMM|nr:hypothetical protein BJI67_16365 [Acidihalobacter aeolianus]
MNWCLHRPLDQRHLIKLCAKDYYREHGGDQADWPVVMALHAGENGRELCRYRVDLEAELVFYPEVCEDPADAPSADLPPELPRGTPGWRRRRQERQILEVMARATTPQTGWDVYQKLRRRGRSWSADECCTIMLALVGSNHLKIAGQDPDCGWRYVLAVSHPVDNPRYQTDKEA